MIFKRMICFFLLIPLILSFFAVAEAAERGVSLSSDSSFFNQLNLNTVGMEKVKSAVSSGDYTTAKSELLQYYKAKFASYAPIPADSKDANRVFLAMHDTWSMNENRIAETTVKGTGFNFYSFGKTTDTTGYYVLDILDRPDYAIQICTRENEDTTHRPVLKCYDASGKLISEVVAVADSMIHKGKPDTGYGSDTVLYVKSGMTQNSDGTYLPYNNNSRRVYMKFNVPSGTKHTELVIYARLHGASSSDNNSLPLYQFASFNKSWTESNLTWNYLVKLKAMGHYSWKDIPGGFDWKQPEGVSDYDWLDSNSRFYELVALAQTAVDTTDATQRKAYFAKLKEILLDFITDTNVRTGFPVNRDRETSSRMMNFPYIYKQLLAKNVLTANENKKLLAYVYDELTFMDNGATIFDNSGSNHGASAYTNHSVYHLGGFYAAIAYWPEFKSNAAWRKRYDSRVDFVLTTLINSDGSYNEVSFGYPRGVLSVNSYLIYCMQERNDTSATVKKYINASILLARYLMDCSYPNGRNPYWGQGSTSSAIRGHINTFLGYLGNKYDNDPNVKALRHFVSNTEGTPSDTVAQYTPVKIVTDRTGWSANDSMIFMNAKSAGYHGHRDALALLYYYGGRSLLTDTGTTSASTTHPHYHFQHSSTRSHNTIEIDGKAQTWQKLPSAGTDMGDVTIAGNDSYSSISSWTKANNNNISTTNASGSKVTHSTNFTHYRHVSYLKELGEILFVSDKVVPGDSVSHSYTQNWHAAPYSNPTIATDSYDTGRTNFSSGANLLIAQVNGSSTTGSLQTGYDASASATTTKYFQYQKTGTGTVTYQTVLYPMAEGTIATVQPTKITMSGTSDATALASRISVNDSSRPTVKNIYHYHSFESTPGTRSFDSYTTNAGTVTLVQDGNDQLRFAALSKGSSLSSGNTVILKAPVTVTDLAVTLEDGVLSVESSDPNADSAMITVNLSGQAVHEVYYNGTVAGFTQTADGTVTVRGQYPLVHFNGGDLLGNISQWTTNGCSASIKNGTMTGSLTGADPYVKSTAAFAYSLQKGDVVEIRIKYNITSGTYSGLQFFWLTEDSTQYNGTNRLLHSASAYPQDEYILVRMYIPDSSVGDVMTGLRVDPVGTGTTNIPTGTYTIDYIYVGPAQEAPSEHTQSLFFDFTNDRTAELRYTSSAYGDRNYDVGNWYGNLSRNSVAYFDGDALRYSVVDGQTSTYFQTSHTGSLTALSLSYTPKAEDWVQVRLRLENMQAVSGSEPMMKLSYIKNNVSGAIDTADNTAIHGLATALNGKYVVLSAPLTDSFRSATAINALRLTLTGITNVSGKTGRVYLDYIFVGTRSEMPNPMYIVTFKGSDGSILGTATVAKGETAAYSGATPTKAKDNSYHYTFNGWDKALTNITADTVVTAQFTPTAHSITYTVIDAQSHTVGCENCDLSEIAPHSYENGICVCGEKEIKEPVEDVTLKLNHSLNLASDISMNLVVPKTLLAGFDMDTVYVESTLETYEGNEKTGTQTIRVEPVDNGYFYYFTLDGLTAVQMNDRISSVLYGTKEGQPYYSPVDVYSIATYAYAQLNKTDIVESLKILCADLLRYGSKAQIFKAYRTDSLADRAMTEEHRAYLSDVETVIFGNTNRVLNDLPNAPIAWAGKSLNLESKVALKFVFHMGSYTGALSELSLRISYTDAYGNEKTATLSGPEAYGQGTGAYVFSVDSLLAAELRAVISAQIYAGDKPVSCTLQYSADTYGNNKTGTLLDLCKALFAYADSAKVYFAP